MLDVCVPKHSDTSQSEAIVLKTLENGRPRRFLAGVISVLTFCSISQIAKAETITTGTFVRGSSPAVYMVSAGQKRHISSPEVFAACGPGNNNVTMVTDAQLNLFPVGQPIQTSAQCMAAKTATVATAALTPRTDGALVRSDAAVYLIVSGSKRHITSGEIFSGCGLAFINVQVITRTEINAIPTGDPILSTADCKSALQTATYDPFFFIKPRVRSTTNENHAELTGPQVMKGTCDHNGFNPKTGKCDLELGVQPEQPYCVWPNERCVLNVPSRVDGHMCLKIPSNHVAQVTKLKPENHSMTAVGFFQLSADAMNSGSKSSPLGKGLGAAVGAYNLGQAVKEGDALQMVDAVASFVPGYNETKGLMSAVASGIPLATRIFRKLSGTYKNKYENDNPDVNKACVTNLDISQYDCCVIGSRASLAGKKQILEPEETLVVQVGAQSATDRLLLKGGTGGFYTTFTDRSSDACDRNDRTTGSNPSCPQSTGGAVCLSKKNDCYVNNAAHPAGKEIKGRFCYSKSINFSSMAAICDHTPSSADKVCCVGVPDSDGNYSKLDVYDPNFADKETLPSDRTLMISATLPTKYKSPTSEPKPLSAVPAGHYRITSAPNRIVEIYDMSPLTCKDEKVGHQADPSKNCLHLGGPVTKGDSFPLLCVDETRKCTAKYNGSTNSIEGNFCYLSTYESTTSKASCEAKSQPLKELQCCVVDNKGEEAFFYQKTRNRGKNITVQAK